MNDLPASSRSANSAFSERKPKRVDRLSAGLRGVHDLVDHEITFRGGRGADKDGLIGHIDREAVAIGFGKTTTLTPMAGGADDAATSPRLAIRILSGPVLWAISAGAQRGNLPRRETPRSPAG